MTYLIPSNLPLAPDTRKRPPQSGFVQTGFEEIKEGSNIGIRTVSVAVAVGDQAILHLL